MDLAMFLVETQAKVKGTKMTETELPDRIKPFYDFVEKSQISMQNRFLDKKRFIVLEKILIALLNLF